MAVRRSFKDAASDLMLFWTEQGNHRYNVRLKLEIRTLPDSFCRLCLTDNDGRLEYVPTVVDAPTNENLLDGIYYYRYEPTIGFVRERDLFEAILKINVRPRTVICTKVFGEVWKIEAKNGNFKMLIARTPNERNLKRDKSPQEFDLRQFGGA